MQIGRVLTYALHRFQHSIEFVAHLRLNIGHLAEGTLSSVQTLLGLAKPLLSLANPLLGLT